MGVNNPHLKVFSKNQITVEYEDDIEAIILCIWCCYKANCLNSNRSVYNRFISAVSHVNWTVLSNSCLKVVFKFNSFLVSSVMSGILFYPFKNIQGFLGGLVAAWQFRSIIIIQNFILVQFDFFEFCNILTHRINSAWTNPIIWNIFLLGISSIIFKIKWALFKKNLIINRNSMF